MNSRSKELSRKKDLNIPYYAQSLHFDLEHFKFGLPKEYVYLFVPLMTNASVHSLITLID